MIFATGSIDVNGVKKVFIARIEALNGNLLAAEYYDVVNANFNSRGFKILTTESDATGDGNPNAGVLVTGFFSSCYNFDNTCNLNIGFALRTDLTLNFLWSAEVDSPVTGNNDFDFVNGAVETSDGFLLTGSANHLDNGTNKAAVLAHKLDFEGNFVWDNSYFFGNSRDLSVDGYYDTASNEIYLLTNYSNFHHFGVTVLNNTTGAIDFTKTWYVNEVNFELDFYGFSILESLSNTDNLLVYGYRRNYFNGTSNDQSNVIVHEFEKNNGNQVGSSYQYLLPFQETPGDEFSFWNSPMFPQMPEVYYPDMAINDFDAATTAQYTVGYRNGDPATGGFANIEFFKIESQKTNVCDNMTIDYTTNAINSVTPISTNISSLTITSTKNTLSFNPVNLTLVEDSCDPNVSVNDPSKTQIKIYPNPTSSYVYININDINEVSVFDINGKKVFETKSYDKTEGLYLGDLNNGIYFVNVKTNEFESESFKIVKQ
ncbi:T9SS type A sorting domain-containing protein [Mesohalobacter halotolerans]|uniref:T9SS type A sorting domain-containing protein n=1 Tax=Mesohalobacter halotolerans TaxID=1883405 RepID=A0A4U5TQL7_9FLAO|nr:T9SS type A sorting domain-containing protein [Mesohalobacter halotolerans]MBS3738975.1 T9SS type A sorting domain-containing protein [Psychroflexus sp.]TKS56343.1 T9SS type A sorting domain-containing protein [Mesohalobacter halotolerans]